MLEELSHINPSSFSDSSARSALQLTLNVIEQKHAQNIMLTQQVQELKDEIARFSPIGVLLRRIECQRSVKPFA